MTVEDLQEDQELWYPVTRLREEGAAVLVAGPQKKRQAGGSDPSCRLDVGWHRAQGTGPEARGEG